VTHFEFSGYCIHPLAKSQAQIELNTQEESREQIQKTLAQTQAQAQAREQAREKMQEILAQMQAQAQAREEAQARVQELKRTQMHAQIELRVLRALAQGVELKLMQARLQEVERVQREELKQAQREVLQEARALAQVPELPPQEQEWARKLEQELVEQMQVQ
jgi:hypothetical protein